MRKFVPRKKSFVPTSFCRRATQHNSQHFQPTCRFVCWDNWTKQRWDRFFKLPVWSKVIQCHAEGGATKGGVSKCEQMQTNADKRWQTQANAGAKTQANAGTKTQANASKREQTWTNANKRLHPLHCGFLHPPFAIPLLRPRIFPRILLLSFPDNPYPLNQGGMEFHPPTLRELNRLNHFNAAITGLFNSQHSRPKMTLTGLTLKNRKVLTARSS